MINSPKQDEAKHWGEAVERNRAWNAECVFVLSSTRQAEAIDFLRFYFGNKHSEVEQSMAIEGLQSILEILGGYQPVKDTLRLRFERWKDFRRKEARKGG